MFTCESCGHPLANHNPCNAPTGKGKKARPCGCPEFQPADLRERVASLTDNPGTARAAIAAVGGKLP